MSPCFYVPNPLSTGAMWIINADHVDIAKRLLMQYLRNEPIDEQAFYHKMNIIKDCVTHDGGDLKRYAGYASDIQEWIAKNITEIENNQVMENFGV